MADETYFNIRLKDTHSNIKSRIVTITNLGLSTVYLGKIDGTITNILEPGEDVDVEDGLIAWVDKGKDPSVIEQVVANR